MNPFGGYPGARGREDVSACCKSRRLGTRGTDDSGDGDELGGRRGIHVRDSSTGNVIEGNSVTNHSVGISLGDSGTPVGNTFEENHIRRNVCGVKGSTAGNVFEDNKLKDNGTDFCPP